MFNSFVLTGYQWLQIVPYLRVVPFGYPSHIIFKRIEYRRVCRDARAHAVNQSVSQISCKMFGDHHHHHLLPLSLARARASLRLALS